MAQSPWTANDMATARNVGTAGCVFFINVAHIWGYRLSLLGGGPIALHGLVHFLNTTGPSLTKVVYAYFDRISYETWLRGATLYESEWSCWRAMFFFGFTQIWLTYIDLMICHLTTRNIVIMGRHDQIWHKMRTPPQWNVSCFTNPWILELWLP